MTVKQLQEQLALLPPNLMVVVNLGRNELANGKEVTKVEVVKVSRWLGREAWDEDNGYDDDYNTEHSEAVNIGPDNLWREV